MLALKNSAAVTVTQLADMVCSERLRETAMAETAGEGIWAGRCLAQGAVSE